MIVFEIATYSVRIYGKRTMDSIPIAEISLYDSTNSQHGYVDFYMEGQSIPDNELGAGNIVKLKMNERQLNNVVDMLRNEKPCSLVYHSPTSAWITTHQEDVGEGES